MAVARTAPDGAPTGRTSADKATSGTEAAPATAKARARMDPMRARAKTPGRPTQVTRGKVSQ